ncbi:MAG: SOS response-associated peptidase [Cyanobacteriota bacterium]|nr:SOS response-associated peptidase [Cyanobacteriota bacterium]
MCGRFGLAATAQELFQHFGLDEILDISPRYNIAPGQSIYGVLQDPHTGTRSLHALQWGLIPSWAKDPKPIINARAETLTEKPTFRTALRQRRCLIPADGFYEWQGRGKSKQPFHIGLKEGSLFAFAGLWETWKSPAGSVIDSCAIITTAPNQLMAGIHDRMPVIVDPSNYEVWLDPTLQDPARVVPLLQTYPAAEMVAYPVSNRVNNAKHEDPLCREFISLEKSSYDSYFAR